MVDKKVYVGYIFYMVSNFVFFFRCFSVESFVVNVGFYFIDFILGSCEVVCKC